MFEIGRKQKGFTLLEVLLVVAVIAILAGIVIIAINPSKQLGDSRNTQRQADVNTILNAVYQYTLDNNGSFPAAVTGTPTELCKSTVTPANCTSSSLIDLTAVVSSGKYIVSLPIDPLCPTNCHANGTGYRISRDGTTGRVTVTAINQEQGKTITVSR